MTPRIIRHDGVAYVGFLDVSAWQFRYANSTVHPDSLPPDYVRAVNAGLGGCIHRIGNGDRADLSFGLGWRAAREVGLPYGAYYYAQPNGMSGRAAAEWVVRAAAPFGLELPLMLDFEDYNGPDLSPSAMYRWLRDWFDRVEELTGRKALLYAGAAFASPSTVAGTLADIDTVQPRYPRSTPPPINLDEWSGWIAWQRTPNVNVVLGMWEAWQFSSSGVWSAYGGRSDAAVDRVDVNVVPHDVWRRWLRLPDPTPTPIRLDTEDVTMYQVRHTQPGWPGEAIFNVTADEVIHLQNGDAANVDAFVGGVPTVSNTQAWRGGDEQAPGSFVPFSRAMLLQLLRDPARRHVSYVPGEGNVGNPFSGAFLDTELSDAWMALRYDRCPPATAIPSQFTAFEEVTRRVTIT